MTKEEARQIFHPFYQIPHNQHLNPSGVGVGLSICKQICESLGGEIEAFTAPNCGSNFVFTMEVFEIMDDNVP